MTIGFIDRYSIAHKQLGRSIALPSVNPETLVHFIPDQNYVLIGVQCGKAGYRSCVPKMDCPQSGLTGGMRSTKSMTRPIHYLKYPEGFSFFWGGGGGGGGHTLYAFS